MKIIKKTILPYPKSIEACNPELKNTASSIPQQWNRLNKYSSNVNVTYCPDMKLCDEYELTVAENNISISAGSERAAYYACCTLKQLDADFRGEIHDWADIDKRIVMIDLKRISWNFDYLLGLIKRFSELKINYVLIEYEDKFPFEDVSGIAVESAFSKEQIKKLNELAHEHFIEIIPLVQSLGHWEYILSNEKYAGLREDPRFFSQSCPLNSGTFELFGKMASELIAAHPYSTMLHIGADEPFLLGTCDQCKAYANEHGEDLLYIEYVSKVLEWVIDKSLTPLCWADTVRKYDNGIHKIPASTILVDWEYLPSRTRSEKVTLCREDKVRIDYEDFSELTPVTQKRFKPYLKPDSKSNDFYSFPFLAFLQDTGHKVMGAGNINNVDNILAHAEAAIDHNTPGIMATYWGAANSLRVPYTIYEARMPGVIMTAAASWNFNYEKTHRSSFFERCAGFVYPGTVSPACLEILNGQKNLLVSGAKDNLAGIKPIPCSSKDICTTIANKMILEQWIDTFSLKWMGKPLFRPNDYKIIDLSNIANSRFKYFANQPGWPNEHADLRDFPRGKRCKNGIIYKFNTDEKNDPLSLIMAGNGVNGTSFPKRITIPIKRKVSAVSFIHALVEGYSNNKIVGKYVFKYSDGKKVEVPLVNHKNISSWWRVMNCSNADIAWAGKIPSIGSGKVGMLNWTYITEKSDVELLSVELLCDTPSIIALAALTVINPQVESSMPGKISSEIESIRKSLKQLKHNFNSQLPAFVGNASKNEILELAFDNSFNRLRRLENLLKLNCSANAVLELV